MEDFVSKIKMGSNLERYLTLSSGLYICIYIYTHIHEHVYTSMHTHTHNEGLKYLENLAIISEGEPAGVHYFPRGNRDRGNQTRLHQHPGISILKYEQITEVLKVAYVTI